jgi:hypothetical protein
VSVKLLVVTIHLIDAGMEVGPVTVSERSKACTVFARSELGIVGSNTTQGMDVWKLGLDTETDRLTDRQSQCDFVLTDLNC